MPAMVGWVRWLVVGGGRGRWSVRGGVPTLERGNDPLGIPAREVEGWPRQEGGSGHGGFPGKKNSPLALSRSAGCGTGKKGQAV